MAIHAERFDPGCHLHDHAVRYIVRNLRPEELYECSAVGIAIEQVHDVIDMATMLGEGWLLYSDDGYPVFVWGVTKGVAGNFSLWGFGTKETKRHMLSITRWGVKTWLPDFLARTRARRIEVRVPMSSVHSIRWLKSLGMTFECILPNYSVVGEGFVQLASTYKVPNVHTVPVRDQNASAA